MRSFKIFIYLFFLSALCCGCDDYSSYTVYFFNHSNHTVIPFIGFSNQFPDTLLLETEDAPNPVKPLHTSILYYEDGEVTDLFSVDKRERDTLSLFILDSDTVDFYSLDTVIRYNMVLQRYDFSPSNLEEITSSKYYSILYFPPNKAMKHIHMWPPYGTYDEQGRRRKGK